VEDERVTLSHAVPVANVKVRYLHDRSVPVAEVVAAVPPNAPVIARARGTT
jgi:hypothetical protein